MAGEFLVERVVGVGARPRAGVAWLLPVLVTLFFLTGISGLIYQVLWLRLLALVFGVTIWAASTVLASFMAGLAIGSFAAGRFVDRVRHPLLWYGVAEMLVSGSALLTPWALDGLEGLYVALYPALPPGLAPLTVARFLLSFAVLIVPTTLMGATLPIIVKSSLLRAEGLGERVSLLYATNTAGAIVGTVVAGFYLVGGIGVARSFQLAATINVLVGLAAVAMSFAVRPEAATTSPAARSEPARRQERTAEAPPSERTRRAVLVVFALSGFASLALEVIWFRILVLFLDVTTYAFTVMLAIYLCGIAAGSYLVTPLMRRRWPWLRVLAGLELAIGVAAVLSMFLLSQSYTALGLVELVLRRPLPTAMAQAVFTSFLAIFPPTLLLGVAFPIGLRLWAGDGAEGVDHTGERIGLFYSLNVCGAILGSIAAGFLLLPVIGSQASLVLVSAIALGSGLWLLWLDRSPEPAAQRQPSPQPSPRGRGSRPKALSPWERVGVRVGARGRLATLGVLAFAVVAVTMPSPFGVVLANRYPGERTLWREEGVQTTVTVNERPDGHRALYLDGLHQANDEAEMVFLHRLIGYLPMTLHPDPKQALVVGLGGGVTAGAVAEHHQTRVDLVELAGSVVHGSEWFRHVNHDVLYQPNLHLREDDGRNFLLLSPPDRYDVITADIIQPFHAGAGNLYSAEYFRLARRALKDDGVMLQWIGVLPETQYKLIMRTFLSVFPDTTLWMEGSLMVGQKHPLKLNQAVYQRKLDDPTTGAELKAMHFGSLLELFSIYWAGAAEMQAYVGDGPILTDDQPMVEYFRSLPRNEPLRDVMNLRGDALKLLEP